MLFLWLIIYYHCVVGNNGFTCKVGLCHLLSQREETSHKKKKGDNYSKPPWGLARLRFAYPWFKTYHFAPLYFNPLPPPPRLPTWPSVVRKTPFYSKLEHNTDQTTKIHPLFLTSPRNAKILVTELGFWFFWLCFRMRVRHWIFKDRLSPGTTFLLRHFCFMVLSWGFKFWW